MNNIQINKYPFNNDCAFAITIDDLHPESHLNKNQLDFGYDKNGDFWRHIEEASKIESNLRYTIFTVANWVDISDFPDGYFWPLRKFYRKRREYPADTFNISDPKFKDWTSFLNEMQKKYNIEYATHGLIHHNSNLKYATSQEFLAYDTKQTQENLTRMLKLFDKSGLKYSKGFRSPGWGLRQDQIQSLADKKFEYIAGSSNFIDPIDGLNIHGAGLKNTKITDITQIDGLPNFTANAYPNQTQRIVEIARQNGIIIVHTHIAYTTYGLKYIDKNFAQNISKALQEIKMQTAKKIWFATLQEITNYTHLLQNVITTDLGDEIQITNNNDQAILGLTLKINNIPVIIDINAKTTLKLPTNNIDHKQIPVSIVLSVYNGAKSIIPSLDSLATQSHTNAELIVVNDGSKDNTAELVQNYIDQTKDPRIQLINQSNLGRSRARNAGLNSSTGKIVTFAEDDAYYTKDYIALCIKHFDSPDKIGGVIGPHYVWNKNESFNTRVKDLERRRNFHNYKPKSCWFYDNAKLKELGGFNENMELAEDVEPAMRLAQEGYKFKFEKDAVWLHMEPANFRKYLRRKFRGGVGMAILRKMNLKDHIIPRNYIYVLFAGTISFTLTLLLQPLLALSLLALIPVVLIGIRYKSIQLARQISNESLIFIVFSVLIEYIWWSSTLLGYLKGRTMSLEAINKYLKGR